MEWASLPAFRGIAAPPPRFMTGGKDAPTTFFEATKPGFWGVSLGKDAEKPVFDSVVPRIGDANPGYLGVRPEFLGVRPGFFGVRPGFLGVRPGFLGARPGFLGVRPGFLGVGPGFLGVKPETGGLKPGVFGGNPGIGGVERNDETRMRKPE